MEKLRHFKNTPSLRIIQGGPKKFTLAIFTGMAANFKICKVPIFTPYPQPDTDTNKEREFANVFHKCRLGLFSYF